MKQQKLTLLSSLFDMQQIIVLDKYYDLQISVNIVYFKFKFRDISCVNKKICSISQYKIKNARNQLLIQLETSFKNWQKAQNVNIYSIIKVYIWCYPLPLACLETYYIYIYTFISWKLLLGILFLYRHDHMMTMCQYFCHILWNRTQTIYHKLDKALCRD